jgi:mRNA interferase RelE/StbE
VTPRGQYSIDWTRSALRALNRLPEKVAAAVIEFVYGPLAENPQRVGHPLRFELQGHHSAARGDFRVIYAIDARRHRVIVETIAHRADAYRKR